MNEKTWAFIDKSVWPRGEWDSEPDKVQWIDDTTGLPCLAVRSAHFGNWCGYVGVLREHQYYGQDYDDVPVDTHWGLTYADKCRENDKEHGICHIPDDGQPNDIWWFGFDYAHSGDVLPYRGSPFVGYGRYSTIDDVKKECASVAAQLAGAAIAPLPETETDDDESTIEIQKEPEVGDVDIDEDDDGEVEEKIKHDAYMVQHHV